MSYVTSQINKFNNPDKLPKDLSTLNEIVDRQGLDILIEFVCEKLAAKANNDKMNADERAFLVYCSFSKFIYSLNERI